jgi:ABC-type branched-subunit amino acid transport system ATPase component
MTTTLLARATESVTARARWHPLEVLFWAAAFAAIWLMPTRHLILTEVAWLGLFALSLDLILGYAGIISLGHAAFFGVGAYAAALLAKHALITEPALALIAAGLAAAMLGFVTSFLVLRGSDLTRLMVSLGVALMLRELANQFGELTGGADGLQGVTMEPVLGRFRFDMFGHTGYIYSLIVLFVLFMLARRLVNSPFGLSVMAIKGNPRRGDRHTGRPAADRHLYDRGVLRRYRRRAAGADHGVRFARRVLPRPLGRSTAGADHRRRRLSLWRADRRDIIQVDAGLSVGAHAAILAVLDRPAVGRFGSGRAGAHRLMDRPIPRVGVAARLARGAQCGGGAQMTVALQTIGLFKQFGGLTATHDVSLRIEAGARHALIGPNGAGKTTLINLLSGVLRPTAGHIRLGNEDITNLSQHQRVRRGMVRTFQINQLFGDLTPLETLGLAVSERNGHGMDWWRIAGSKPELIAEMSSVLETFHLADVMNERTAILPYGKQRLLEIAVAIACKPRVLLLDEPAAGVPEDERHEILASIAALPSDVTVLLIEHDMDIVFSFAQKISVLVNGGLLTEGAPADVARDPRVKAVYLGEVADA